MFKKQYGKYVKSSVHPHICANLRKGYLEINKIHGIFCYVFCFQDLYVNSTVRYCNFYDDK